MGTVDGLVGVMPMDGKRDRFHCFDTAPSSLFGECCGDGGGFGVVLWSVSSGVVQAGPRDRYLVKALAMNWDR